MKRPRYEDYDMIYHSQIYIDHLKKYADYLEDKAIRRRSKIGYIIFVVLVLGSCLCCLGQDKIHKDEVYDYILASDIYERQIVFSQVLKETGRLECDKCSLSRNNLFGFRYNHKYLEFDTWQESIDYYERWQLRKGYTEEQDYYEFLINKWGAPNMLERYIPRLKLTK